VIGPKDTFLLMEAVLCGCPVVLLPSEIFKECHTLEDFGTNGVAWKNEPEVVRTAQSTVAQGRDDYFRVVSCFGMQLERFVHDTRHGSSGVA
jgi:hypothetical protein